MAGSKFLKYERPNTGNHPDHPPVEGGYRGDPPGEDAPETERIPCGDISAAQWCCEAHMYEDEKTRQAQLAEARAEGASSVIGEAVLADALRMQQPDAPAPTLSVPPLEYLFREWQRRSGHTLPVDSTERKAIPIRGGCNNYFPAALAAVAAWSYFNNQKHNPGQPLHWSQHKSGDHDECLARHAVDEGDAVVADDTFTAFVEATAQAWRALGRLQMMAQRLGAPVAPGSRPAGDGGAP